LGSLLNLIGVVGILKENFLLNFIFNERNLEFLFGIASAYLILKFPIKHPSRLISVAAFLLTISAINSNYNLVKISSVISSGIPFMLLIIGSVAIENSRNLKIPNSLIQIGDSSYTIYLIHGFIIVNICKVLLKSPLSGIFQNFILVNLIGIIIWIMTIAIGAIIYHYIERPLLTTLRINLIDKMSKKPSRSTL
jgi:peptidoglycan/LPS O-acetylase OafA/YrhL